MSDSINNPLIPSTGLPREHHAQQLQQLLERDINFFILLAKQIFEDFGIKAGKNVTIKIGKEDVYKGNKFSSSDVEKQKEVVSKTIQAFLEPEKFKGEFSFFLGKKKIYAIKSSKSGLDLLGNLNAVLDSGVDVYDPYNFRRAVLESLRRRELPPSLNDALGDYSKPEEVEAQFVNAEQVNAVNAEQVNVSTQFNTNQINVGEILEKLRELSERIDRLEKKQQEHLDSSFQRDEALTTYFEDIDWKLSNIESQQKEQNSQANQLNEDLVTLRQDFFQLKQEGQQRLELLQEINQRLSQKLDSLESTPNTVKDFNLKNWLQTIAVNIRENFARGLYNLANLVAPNEIKPELIVQDSKIKFGESVKKVEEQIASLSKKEEFVVGAKDFTPESQQLVSKIYDDDIIDGQAEELYVVDKEQQVMRDRVTDILLSIKPLLDRVGNAKLVTDNLEISERKTDYGSSIIEVFNASSKKHVFQIDVMRIIDKNEVAVTCINPLRWEDVDELSRLAHSFQQTRTQQESPKNQVSRLRI
jgi:hypothetical protein